MNKSEIARRLDVSKSYITMLEQGIRTPSKKMQRKINKLLTEGSLQNTFLTHGVQVVVGSNPTTPTSRHLPMLQAVRWLFAVFEYHQTKQNRRANKINKRKFRYKIIAPCRINCGVCKAHLRNNNPCPVCNFPQPDQPKTRRLCPIRLCNKRLEGFCYSCAEFPCDRLRRLDKRYRTRYGMSEIENLNYIRDHGIKLFIEEEHKRWVSKQGILCVHDKKYY